MNSYYYKYYEKYFLIILISSLYMENINEHSFLNTKHKLSFSQYGNSFEQLKYKAKKIIKNVIFLNSNISLLSDIQQQINHSHCVQKSLNKISKNSIIWKAVIVQLD